MTKLGVVALLAAVAAVLAGCQSQTVVPSPVKPTLVDITVTAGGLARRAAIQTGLGLRRPGGRVPAGGTSMANCPQRCPDTAFIDSDIPSLTNFTVDSGGVPFTLVGRGADGRL